MAAFLASSGNFASEVSKPFQAQHSGQPLTILSHASKAHSFPQRSQHTQQAHHSMEWPESRTPGVHHDSPDMGPMPSYAHGVRLPNMEAKDF